MRIRRNLLGASALLAGAAAVLVGAASMSQASAGTDAPGAFGLAANGPVSIQPLPSVVSPDGKTVRRAVLEPKNALVDASALVASTDARHSEARAADVSTLEKKVYAGAISARCEGGKGVANLERANIGGRKIESNPAPNTTIPVTVERYGTASVTLNKQVRQPDGRLAVTGMAINVPLPNGKTQTIDVASVKCGPAEQGAGTGDDVNDRGAVKDGSGLDKKKSRPEGETDISTVVREQQVPKAPAPIPAKVALPVAG